MAIRVLAVGKKHEAWVADGIKRYETRLRGAWGIDWQLIPHSSREGDAARNEESARILQKITADEWVILLDERGSMLDSPELSKKVQNALDTGKKITVIIGGAYGVNSDLHSRANLVWSLSKLVFPHQLVRLILAEQIYRASEISRGSGYHHI